MKISTDDVVARTGITFRRLDHWARLGYLQVPVTGQGKGKGREWPDKEIRAAVLIDRITKGGIATPKAAKIARLLVDTPSDKTKRSARIADGVWVTIDMETNQD